MPGPLPADDKRRRNAPTIPTTDLDADGPSWRPPPVPKWMQLGPAGTAWWKWAWKTPQACAWGRGSGFEPLVARRAQLEDDLAAIAAPEGLDLSEIADAETLRAVRQVVQSLAALVTGKLAIIKEMRELEDRLGLSPKGMAQLRWKVRRRPAGSPAAAAAEATGNVRSLTDRRQRLTDAS